MVVGTKLQFLGPTTTHVFNPVMRLFAGRLPGLAIVTHVGRATGRAYRAPLLVFQRDGTYVFGLWYGARAQWVRNVLASGNCEIRLRGRDVHLVAPELFVDPTRRVLPLPLRMAGRLVGLSAFLRMRVSRADVSARTRNAVDPRRT